MFKFSAPKLLFAVLAAVAITTNAKSDFIPLSPVGNVAAVQSSIQGSGSGNIGAFLYYQQPNGTIVVAQVTGPFTNGTSTTPVIGNQIVPPGEAMLGTPIAACSHDTGTGNTGLDEIHVFFFSPSNQLSEYVWTTTTGYQGGASCSICITQSGFSAVNGSQVLYAMLNPNDRTVHVGFISVGSPGTLSEAVRTPGGAWSVASLPNKP